MGNESSSTRHGDANDDDNTTVNTAPPPKSRKDRAKSATPSGDVKRKKKKAVKEDSDSNNPAAVFLDSMCGGIFNVTDKDSKRVRSSGSFGNYSDHSEDYSDDETYDSYRDKRSARKHKSNNDANSEASESLVSEAMTDDYTDASNAKLSRRSAHDTSPHLPSAADEDESTLPDRYDSSPNTKTPKPDSLPSSDIVASPSDAVSSLLLSKPLASSFAKRCYFTKSGIGKITQHYEGLTLTGNVVLMLAMAMKLKGCPTICDEDLRRVEQTFPNQFSRLPDELLLSSGWRRISKYCHFSMKPIPDGIPFFHSKKRCHPTTGGYYFLLAAAVGMIRPIDVEPLTLDTLIVLQTDFPHQCDAAPSELVEDPEQWTLVDKFCFFSGGPINTEEDVYYRADFDGNLIYMLAFLSPSLTPDELYHLDSDGKGKKKGNKEDPNSHQHGLHTIVLVEQVESVYDLTDRDFDDLKLYHLGPCRALPPYILQPGAWTKVLPPHFLRARDLAMARARELESAASGGSFAVGAAKTGMSQGSQEGYVEFGQNLNKGNDSSYLLMGAGQQHMGANYTTVQQDIYSGHSHDSNTMVWIQQPQNQPLQHAFHQQQPAYDAYNGPAAYMIGQLQNDDSGVAVEQDGYSVEMGYQGHSPVYHQPIQQQQQQLQQQQQQSLEDCRPNQPTSIHQQNAIIPVSNVTQPQSFAPTPVPESSPAQPSSTQIPSSSSGTTTQASPFYRAHAPAAVPLPVSGTGSATVFNFYNTAGNVDESDQPKPQSSQQTTSGAPGTQKKMLETELKRELNEEGAFVSNVDSSQPMDEAVASRAAAVERVDAFRPDPAPTLPRKSVYRPDPQECSPERAGASRFRMDPPDDPPDEPPSLGQPTSLGGEEGIVRVAGDFSGLTLNKNIEVAHNEIETGDFSMATRKEIVQHKEDIQNDCKLERNPNESFSTETFRSENPRSGSHSQESLSLEENPSRSFDDDFSPLQSASLGANPLLSTSPEVDTLLPVKTKSAPAASPILARFLASKQVLSTSSKRSSAGSRSIKSESVNTNARSLSPPKALPDATLHDGLGNYSSPVKDTNRESSRTPSRKKDRSLSVPHDEVYAAVRRKEKTNNMYSEKAVTPPKKNQEFKNDRFSHNSERFNSSNDDDENTYDEPEYKVGNRAKPQENHFDQPGRKPRYESPTREGFMDKHNVLSSTTEGGNSGYSDHDGRQDRNHSSHDDESFSRSYDDGGNSFDSPQWNSRASPHFDRSRGGSERYEHQSSSLDSNDNRESPKTCNFQPMNGLRPASPASPARTESSFSAEYSSSSAMRGAHELLRKNRQKRLALANSRRRTAVKGVRSSASFLDDETVMTASVMSATSLEIIAGQSEPVASSVHHTPPQDDEQNWDDRTDITSVVSGSSTWTDNTNPDRSSRRALILQMAKARMKSGKSRSGDSSAEEKIGPVNSASGSQPTKTAQSSTKRTNASSRSNSVAGHDIDLTGDLD